MSMWCIHVVVWTQQWLERNLVILSSRLDYNMIDNQSVALHAFVRHMRTSLSVDDMMLLWTGLLILAAFYLEWRWLKTFFVWALLLIVHTWNFTPLWSNLFRLQCKGSPVVWACQWPSSQPLSSPQLSHNDSLWA